MGSPNVVAVPCASTTSTSAADNPALANAAWITRCWASPLGAVSPLDAPSWLTALPRTTASTECPNRRASDSRSSTTTPAPSPHPVPSAAAANALHRPSAANPRCRENPTKIDGSPITVTPPANAKSHSPERNDDIAQWIATNDDEQALSTDTAGPCSPNTYDTRPEATLIDVPVNPYPCSPPVSLLP
ncbi:Uncharacterised protein [Mycobacterium tuberculosis]|nr:Uncharacterised protein [Mycobacterium tuberculosis]